jgi:hypothetical protein
MAKKKLLTTFASLIFVLLASFTGTFKNTDDLYILWNDSTGLTWDDFLGKAPVNTSLAAMTYTQLSLNPFEYNPPECKISIQAMFDKNKSWVKEKSKTDYLLGHEQLHFDIAELYARKLRKGIKNGVFSSKKLQSQLSDLFHKYNTELSEYESEYDKETNHSKIEEKQKKWEINIPKELEKLKDYKDTLVVISVK